jgi:hypothetical protein
MPLQSHKRHIKPLSLLYGRGIFVSVQPFVQQLVTEQAIKASNSRRPHFDCSVADATLAGMTVDYHMYGLCLSDAYRAV